MCISWQPSALHVNNHRLLTAPYENKTSANILLITLKTFLCYKSRIMTAIAGGHGEPNPNASWLGARGMWLAYILGVLAVHLILLSVPFISIPIAWTITNLLHNGVSHHREVVWKYI